MRARGTLVLALALGALCLGYWSLQQRGTQQQAEAIEAKRLFNFDADTVRTLDIQRLGEDASAAIRQGEDGWAFTKPNAEIQANQAVWDRAAHELAELRSERTIAVQRPADLAQYGLEEPTLTVHAETAAGEIALDFGNVEPTQTYRYALLDGETLFLVDNKKQFFELNRPLDDLRNRFLVDRRDANIVRIEFARIFTGDEDIQTPVPVPPGTESTPVAMARDNAEAPWRLLNPVQAPADQDAVAALVKELQFAVGRNYNDTPESLQDYGLDPPAVRVSLVDDVSGKAQTIFFGHFDNGPGGGLTAKRAEQNAVFMIDPHVLSLFPTSPSAFRARKLFTTSATTLSKLDYYGPQGDFVLARDAEGTWAVVDPPAPDANPNAISNFIARLKRTEASRFLDGELADYGLDDPAVRIVLTDEDGTESEIRLRENPDEATEFYVTQDTGGAAIAPASVADGLIIGPDAFLSRNLMHFPPQQAVQLAFLFEGTEYLLDKVHDTWLVRQPGDHRLANQADVKTILDAVTPLDAVRPALPEESDGQGDSIPVLSFRVTLRDDAGERSTLGPLRVGAVSPADSRYRIATAAGREGIWVVNQTLIEAFREAVHGIVPKAAP